MLDADRGSDVVRMSAVEKPVPITNEEGAKQCGCCSPLAMDAVIACSQLPILQNFRDNGYAAILAGLVIASNVVALIGLTIYFLYSCSRLYGMLPNQWDMDPPPALATLESQEGVTIVKTQMIYFQAEESYTQEINGVARAFWEPLAVTCGCDTCDLLSCQATVPLTVEYDQCNPLAEVRDV